MSNFYLDENAGDASWRWVKPLDEAFVVVCGIVRNAERGLKANIPVVQSFCDCCKDWRVVVFENDSKDRTKDILRKYAINDEIRGGEFRRFARTRMEARRFLARER